MAWSDYLDNTLPIGPTAHRHQGCRRPGL